nr:uncharacterized protein LOC118878374 [Drosophila suzukii]
MENIELSAKEKALMQISATIRKWVNETLKTDIQCIEELCSGAIYCQLLDLIFENVVPLKEVIFATNAITDFRKNFAILQDCLHVLQIPIEIPVEKLVWCDFEANLRFAANFYKYFKLLTTKNRNRRLSYDPLAARNYQSFSLAPPSFVSRGTDAQNPVELAFAGMNIVDYEDIKDVLDLKDFIDSQRVENTKDNRDDMDLKDDEDMDMEDIEDEEDNEGVERVEDVEDIERLEGAYDMDMEDIKVAEDLENSNEDYKIAGLLQAENKDHSRRLSSKSYAKL